MVDDGCVVVVAVEVEVADAEWICYKVVGVGLLIVLGESVVKLPKFALRLL